MPGPCCASPIATIIKVGSFDAGIVGLESALRNVYISGAKDDEQIKSDLLKWVKGFGNYIAPTREDDYRDALYREYRRFVAALEQDQKELTKQKTESTSSGKHEIKRK